MIQGWPENTSAKHLPHVNRRSIRLATYNIRAGVGMDGNYSLDRVAQSIVECDPAIVALQEVDKHWSNRSDFADQVAILSGKLDMHGFFAPIYSLPAKEPGGPDRNYGLAVLSRFPFTHTMNHMMTRLSTQVKDATPAPAPGFADVQIAIRDFKLRLLNVQLDYRADPTVRVMQVRDMLDLVGEPPAAATVLVGDFNALPNVNEMQPLNNSWTDAWDLQGIGEGNTFPSDTPAKRIDRILITPDLAVARIWVHNTQASDHRPLVADLLLPE